MHRPFLLPLTLLFAAVVVLTGCVTPKPAPPLPDTLVITREHAGEGWPALTIRSTDASAVQELYQLVLALRPAPSGTYSCPEDLGHIYRLQFQAGEKPVLEARANTGGCREVQLPDGKVVWTMNSDVGQRFWTRLNALVQ
jgi:hypothetical protein